MEILEQQPRLTGCLFGAASSFLDLFRRGGPIDQLRRHTGSEVRVTFDLSQR